MGSLELDWQNQHEKDIVLNSPAVVGDPKIDWQFTTTWLALRFTGPIFYAVRLARDMEKFVCRYVTEQGNSIKFNTCVDDIERS